jgi:hypothetical protein
MNQRWRSDGSEDAKEFTPNLALVLDSVSPQAVLNGGFAAADADADEVVEIDVRQALDIEINWRTFNLKFRASNDVDFLLTNRQCLQRMVVFLSLISQAFWSPARPESVGELSDGENALTVKLFALLLAHAGQQTEIVLLDSLQSATGNKLAFPTMPI